MKRLVLVLLIVPLCWCSVRADTLGALVTQFRQSVGEKDSTRSLATNPDVRYFLNRAQERVVKLGKYLPKKVDVLFSADSQTYGLPADFKYVDPTNGVIVKGSENWFPVYLNPGFIKDTAVFQYFTAFHGTDTAKLYVRGNQFAAGDTIRVFYAGSAAEMTADSMECQVPDDLEGFVVDEAIILYERAKRAFEAMQVLWQDQRQDLGLEKQVRQ